MSSIEISVARCNGALRNANQDNIWICPDLSRPDRDDDGTGRRYRLSAYGALIAVVRSDYDAAAASAIEAIKESFAVIPAAVPRADVRVHHFMGDAMQRALEAAGDDASIAMAWMAGTKVYIAIHGDGAAYWINQRVGLERMLTDSSAIIDYPAHRGDIIMLTSEAPGEHIDADTFEAMLCVVDGPSPIPEPKAPVVPTPEPTASDDEPIADEPDADDTPEEATEDAAVVAENDEKKGGMSLWWFLIPLLLVMIALFFIFRGGDDEAEAAIAQPDSVAAKVEKPAADTVTAQKPDSVTIPTPEQPAEPAPAPVTTPASSQARPQTTAPADDADVDTPEPQPRQLERGTNYTIEPGYGNDDD